MSWHGELDGWQSYFQRRIEKPALCSLWKENKFWNTILPNGQKRKSLRFISFLVVRF